MPILDTLPHMILPYLDFAGVLEGLDAELKELEQKIQKVAENRAWDEFTNSLLAIERCKEVFQQPRWWEDFTDLFDMVDQLILWLKSRDEESYKTLLETSAYQNWSKLRCSWVDITQSIGEQSLVINESISHAEEFGFKRPMQQLSVADLSFGLFINTGARFKWEVLHQSHAHDLFGSTLCREAAIVSHYLKASIGLKASVQAHASVIQVAGSTKSDVTLEMTAFYQTSARNKTCTVLHAMSATPIIPWSLGCVSEAIQCPNHLGEMEGYRAFNVIRKASLSLQGELAVGRSISTFSKTAGQPVDIDVSARLKITKHVAVAGEIELQIFKSPTNQLSIRVKKAVRDADENRASLAVGGRITGLDALASHQLEKLLGYGDRLVQSLEVYSNVGQYLADNLSTRTKNSEWASHLNTLFLSHDQKRQSLNEAVGDAIKLVFEKLNFSLSTATDDFTRELTEQLTRTFGIDLQEIVGNPAKESVFYGIQNLIKEEVERVKGEFLHAACQLHQDVQAGSQAALKPIKKISKNAQALIEDTSVTAVELYEKLAQEYTKTKNRIKVALSRAADIQLNLHYQSTSSHVNSLDQSFTIVLKDSTSESVSRLYRSLVVGNDDAVSTLIMSLSKVGVIEYQADSLSLTNVTKNEISLGINVLGYDIDNVSDAVSDLQLHIDPMGKIMLVHTHNLSKQARGFDEARKACFNFSYGFAQAALEQQCHGALSFSYSNLDHNLHSAAELRSVLTALTLSHFNAQLSQSGFGFLPLVSQVEAENALNMFEQYTHPSAGKGIQYHSSDSHSNILITLRAGRYIYNQLLSLDDTRLFDTAFKALLFSEKGRYRNRGWREYSQGLRNIIAAYTRLKPRFHDTANLYRHLGESNSLDYKLIRSELASSRHYQDYFGYYDDTDWRAISKRLALLFRKAAALRDIFVELQKIARYITDLPEYVSHALAKQLMHNINISNQKIERCLEEWIQVDGVFQALLKDLGMAFGVNLSGINTTLLLFMVLLQRTLRQDNLFAVTIELQKNDDSHRSVICVS
ncbi:hypothetical protein N480_10415 [Pseudoalteromonas luteoviolacea S2607]|uniref:hypothetical protein n=1 Tax=Pseudoalteromonas luteoviolacea TaxID=43657 RepID=UPI0007B0476F|nr:hypothetical protein [Pseudoalteromonas luteoviolacea]KZN28498.1 hypothetical protein N480_10415 [Pseudoalteromonas luteoviolacea S2607]